MDHIHSNQEHPSDYSINRRNTRDTLASQVLGGGLSVVPAPRYAQASEFANRIFQLIVMLDTLTGHSAKEKEKEKYDVKNTMFE